MNFLIELWSVIVGSVISWLGSVNNEYLSKISNLLTILVILIGLTDWAVRKLRHKKANKNQQNALDSIENTQKPFRAVNMLNNPMGTGEKIGVLIEDTTKLLGGSKMKKFIKWVWYNKEQLLSIAYNVVVIALANFLMWSDLLNGVVESFVGAQGVLAVKIVAIVISVAFAALTVRNVCVTYGLSSLDTIDKVLADKAAAAEKALTPEQKKQYKAYIATLQTALEKAKAEVATAKTELEKITALYNADNSLVTDFVVKRATYEKKIAASEAVVANIEGKIAEYKAFLNGNN